MKAITVEPRTAGSARLEDVPEPDLHNGSVLVEAVAAGVCGTDIEIADGNTAGLLRASRAWCWATSPWDASWILGRLAG